MSLASLWSPFKIPRFYRLAMFVCHLYTLGDFKRLHVLYDPIVFDTDIIIEIEAMSLNQIQWKKTDITNASAISYNNTETTDYILQLIFFDPNNLVQEIVQFVDFFTINRVFAFRQTDQYEEQLLILKTFSLGISSNTAIAFYDELTDSVFFGWLSINGFHNGFNQSGDFFINLE